MTLSIIVAMTENRVIGHENRLPWHISEDLKRFKALTMGHPIIMGRKTFESIGKALPGRKNIVLTRNSEFKAENIDVVSSLDGALEVAKGAPGGEEVFVIGGSGVFAEALPSADRLYLTLIHDRFTGDAFFPEINLYEDFEILERNDHLTQGDSPLAFTFITAQKKKK